jgi:hypothetical protein
MIQEKQRMTSIDRRTADLFEADGLGAPKVFYGNDGSLWVLSDQLRDYTRTSAAEPK